MWRSDNGEVGGQLKKWGQKKPSRKPPAIRALILTTQVHIFCFFHKYIYICPENPEGNPSYHIGSMNMGYMGYDILPTLPGLELLTCSVTCARRFH